MRSLLSLAAALVLATAPQLAAAAPADAHDESNYAQVVMKPNTAFLSAEERQVVNLLIQAANEMTAIYAKQSAGPGPGHGFYPAGLTKAELDAYVAAHPAEREKLLNGYTVVQRQGTRLVTTPYSVAYKPELTRAAALLEQAAQTTSNASLKRFLTLRAEAFRSNDYFDSEMAWMDVSGTPIEVAIGPYETYTDELYGQKTAFEAFVTVKDPQASAKLERFKAHLGEMEANLPVDDRYKNFKRGGASPIAVADQVHGGGDNLHGPQTIAFNLPNDERVREAKGAKKVILANVLGAKYDQILKPIAARALVAEQVPLVTRDYMVYETLFHELAHSLGPGTITVGGRPTTVQAELKDIYSTSEEAKADVMGAYNILFMMDKGQLPAAERPQLMATYMAGILRAARWGEGEAHGRGAALQYGYLKEKGAFQWDATQKRFRVDDAAMASGLRDLLADLVRLQGDGDYAGMKALFDRYAHLDDHARAVNATLGDIPVDISPTYPEKV
ncbi:hypothetical protein LJR219_001422 [Phenylobacterium sp. LjRoot219]|uniref:dipeptidyl-peptidase 3 family protein n=1 Tax=Phenylobacterium sp. LjRoot219 TaxID=3342283 RepID=UPI003ECCEF60